jgi:hypothetical protein
MKLISMWQIPGAYARMPRDGRDYDLGHYLETGEWRELEPKPALQGTITVTEENGKTSCTVNVINSARESVSN